MIHHSIPSGTGISVAITTRSGNFNYIILTSGNGSDPNIVGNMYNIFWSDREPDTVWQTLESF